ncbi:purple acid phosphatase 18-like [Rosa chinensis]|uniref:purple acid phosphatase 18-like n=1 Tax=Rosa chinensis TaxID=74649 RepID=UPI001AD8AF08|nr:purple acid phosphatase 18-like [Rosa chinensis]
MPIAVWTNTPHYLQPRWDTFGERVQTLASARPWMVTQGNHEKESIPFLKEGFESYNSRWKMPYKESGSSSNLYYSFEVASAHIIMLGSYTDYDEYSYQYKWLKDDLSKVDRQKTPLLLVLFHVPWYNSNIAHQGEGDIMMVAMEPLLYDDLQMRLFRSNPIVPAITELLVAQFMWMDYDNPSKTIYLYINSFGTQCINESDPMRKYIEFEFLYVQTLGP